MAPKQRVRVVTRGPSDPAKIVTYGPATPSIVVINGPSHPIRISGGLTVGNTYRLKFGKFGEDGSGGDTTKPIVTAFVIPATYGSLTVPIITFTATDDVVVTGYLINESPATPSLADPGWQGMPQTDYTFGSPGAKTLYAWARDAAGNISTSLSDSVTITIIVGQWDFSDPVQSGHILTY